MAETLPRRLGEYTLLHRLGAGGMGNVYLSRKESAASITRYCVVKTLRTEGDEERSKRFLDEARVAVHLNHKNICTVSDVGLHEDTLYLVMDLVAGRDLETVRRRREELDLGPLSFPAATQLMKELLEGLDYAHRLTDPTTGERIGLVHRDVSPQNVMISFEGEVNLIDFGLAASSMKHVKTRAGFVMGKLHYLSPEQAQDAPVDARADQFAAAVLGYEAYAGRRYYEGLSDDEVWSALLDESYEPAGIAVIDADVAAVLSRALRRDPAQRYPTCAAFRKALEQVQLERQLTGGSDELRGLMNRLFPTGIAEQRELLAQFTKSSVPALVPEINETLVTGVSQDERAELAGLAEATASRTQEIAQPAEGEPSTEELTPNEGDVGQTVRMRVRTAEDVSATQVIRRPKKSAGPSRSKRGAVLIAATLTTLVAVGLAAWLFSRAGQEPDDPVPVVVTTPPQDPRPPEPPVEADGDDLWQVEDAASGTGSEGVEAAADAGAPANPAAETDLVEEVELRQDRRRARKQSRRRTRRARTAAREAPTTTGGKLKLLSGCGAACAKRLTAQGKTAASQTVTEMRAYLREVDRCVPRCL